MCCSLQHFFKMNTHGRIVANGIGNFYDNVFQMPVFQAVRGKCL
jgi:hypothetical protein